MSLLIALAAAAATPAPPVPKAPEKEENKPTPEPADRVLQIVAGKDGRTIFLSGRIVPGSYNKFKRVLATAPQAETLALASPGGTVIDGFLISAMLRDRGMKTWVGSFCASSCTQIFLAGKDRAAAPGAKLGFHESWRVDENGYVLGSNTDESELDTFMQANFIRSGVDRKFMEKALSTPFSDMWYPDHDEMQKARVLTRRASSAEIISPLPVGAAKAEIEKTILQTPLWQRLQKDDKEFYDEALESAWQEGQSGSNLARIEANAQYEAWLHLMDQIAEAPDPLLGELLGLIQVQLNAKQGLSLWQCDFFGNSEAMTSGQSPMLRDEQTLMVKILEATKVKPLTFGKAWRRTSKLRKGALGDILLQQKTAETAEERCAATRAIITEIVARPDKERLGLFRAFLSLGDIEPNPYG